MFGVGAASRAVGAASQFISVTILAARGWRKGEENFSNQEKISKILF